MTFKKKRKSWISKAFNFTIAVFKHIIDGFRKTSRFNWQLRILTCMDCEHSKNEWKECDVCGCPIEEKAKWKSEKCPKNKWK